MCLVVLVLLYLFIIKLMLAKNAKPQMFDKNIKGGYIYVKSMYNKIRLLTTFEVIFLPKSGCFQYRNISFMLSVLKLYMVTDPY